MNDCEQKIAQELFDRWWAEGADKSECRLNPKLAAENAYLTGYRMGRDRLLSIFSNIRGLPNSQNYAAYRFEEK